ncbi:uncharacterized protein LOC125961674 [Orcinus orca]|uniref:uncharacterized protein LOC125961674 n=1 Tax=Orcinus orca TaxID=9733 RepID=UPI0021125379|nr:uncharacterized protein LOC125961674 [Orcinus orca]
MDLKDHSKRAAAGGATEGRRGLGGGCGGPCFLAVEGWAAVRAARGAGSAEAWVGRCVRDSRRSWTGRERAGDVGRRPGPPRRSGSAPGARSGASGARPPSWSRWRRPGGPRRGELEPGPERGECATPRTWTPGWSPVSRGAAVLVRREQAEWKKVIMTTGATKGERRSCRAPASLPRPEDRRPPKPLAWLGPTEPAAQHSGESWYQDHTMKNLESPVANPADRKGGTKMREKIKGTLGAIRCCCRAKSRFLCVCVSP